jgi:hypothetical protein
MSAIFLEPGQALNKPVFCVKHGEGKRVAINSRHIRLFDYSVSKVFDYPLVVWPCPQSEIWAVRYTLYIFFQKNWRAAEDAGASS